MDTNEIKSSIQTYFDACYESSEEKARQAFHKSAHIYGHGMGETLNDMDLDTFVGLLTSIKTGSPKPDYPRQDEILSIEFTGENTAVARVKLRAGSTLFTDILSFMRLDGKWVIISKLYSGVQAE